MTNCPTFAALLERFFIQRLMQQRQASAHTIASYRDTFRLLLLFIQKRLHKMPSKLALEDLDAPLVVAFLDELETTRGVTARTRNLRLTAIHSFFRYAAFEEPSRAAQIQRVLAIPAKRFTRALVPFLSRPEVDALLAAPDQCTWGGRRDHALILLAVQTGLRLSELTSLRLEDLHLGVGAHVRVIGKGRKERCTPLSKNTQAVLSAWIREPPRTPSQPLFPNASGGRLSAHGVHYLLSKHVATASNLCLSLKQKRVSPHVLRHYLPFLTMSSEMAEVSRRPFEKLWPLSRPTCAITRHSLACLQTVQEPKKLVSRLITPWLAVRRRHLRQGLLLHRECRFEIDLRGFHGFMPEP